MPEGSCPYRLTERVRAKVWFRQAWILQACMHAGAVQSRPLGGGMGRIPSASIDGWMPAVVIWVGAGVGERTHHAVGAQIQYRWSSQQTGCTRAAVLGACPWLGAGTAGHDTEQNAAQGKTGANKIINIYRPRQQDTHALAGTTRQAGRQDAGQAKMLKCAVANAAGSSGLKMRA